MADKPRPKAKATRKPKFTDKAQSERFIEAARKLGISDTSAFDNILSKLVPPRRLGTDHKGR